jgi:hypothetical protein
MKSARVKVDQVKVTQAKILATACENCHTQLSNLNDHYKPEIASRFPFSVFVPLPVAPGFGSEFVACFLIFEGNKSFFFGNLGKSTSVL